MRACSLLCSCTCRQISTCLECITVWTSCYDRVQRSFLAGRLICGVGPPMTPFRGVRSSCDTTDKNSSLTFMLAFRSSISFSLHAPGPSCSAVWFRVTERYMLWCTCRGKGLQRALCASKNGSCIAAPGLEGQPNNVSTAPTSSTSWGRTIVPHLLACSAASLARARRCAMVRKLPYITEDEKSTCGAAAIMSFNSLILNAARPRQTCRLHWHVLTLQHAAMV